jgi:hypothetical protein
MHRSRTGVLFDGSRALECTLERSSASGANVKLKATASVPRRLEFHDGTSRRPATVVWRRTGVIGLRFDDYFRAR